MNEQSPDSHRVQSGNARRGNSAWSVARLFGGFAFGAMGVMLLVAGKSVAGAACIGSATLLVLPLGRLIPNERLAFATRVAGVGLFSAVTLLSIAGTDIVPEQAVTGYKFLDQLLAISRRFVENVGG